MFFAAYGQNRPVVGGYFAGYYNNQPNIVGRRLFIEAQTQKYTTTLICGEFSN